MSRWWWNSRDPRRRQGRGGQRKKKRILKLGDASFLKRDDAENGGWRNFKSSRHFPRSPPSSFPRPSREDYKNYPPPVLTMGSRLKVTKPESAGVAPGRKAELLLSQSGRGQAKKDKGASAHSGNERDARIRKQQGVTLNRVFPSG